MLDGVPDTPHYGFATAFARSRMSQSPHSLSPPYLLNSLPHRIAAHQAAQCPEGVEKAFQDALPKALPELTEEFLKQKEAERSAYWDTPEGKAKREARMAEIKARYEK